VASCAQCCSWLVGQALGGVMQVGEVRALQSTACMAAVEGACSFLEAAMTQMPTKMGQGQMPETAQILEQLMQQLLALQWREPRLLTVYVRLLEAFGRFVAYVCSEAAAPLLLRLFALLEAMPMEPRGPRRDMTENAVARQRVCSAILGLAKEAPRSLAPHLAQMGERIDLLRQAGQLRDMERGSLCEALVLIAGAAGTPQQTSSVLNWALTPVKVRWQDPLLAAQMAGPATFLASFGGGSEWEEPIVRVGEASGTATETPTQRRSSLISDVHLVERTLRRLPAPAAGPEQMEHAYDEHLAWVLPTLLAMLSAVQTLWTPAGRAVIPASLHEALEMTPVERAVLSTVGTAERVRPSSPHGAGAAGPSEGEVLRDWLKNMRDSGYQIMGLTLSHVPSVYRVSGLASGLRQSLLEGIPTMENRHLRAFIRVVVQAAVLHCPQEEMIQREWLGELLPGLLPHMYTRLSQSWVQLLSSSHSTSNSSCSTSSGLPLSPGASGRGGVEGAVSAEVLEERILRELTRDHLALMQMIAAGGAGSRITPKKGGAALAEPGGGLAVGGTVSRPGSGAGSRGEGLLGRAPLLPWLLTQDASLAQQVGMLGSAALSWPDSDGAHKAVHMCKAMVMAVANGLPGSEALVEVVGGAMLGEALRGLTLTSNHSHQGEMVALIRDIVLKVGGRTEAVRKVLLTLPQMSMPALQSFEAELAAQNSDKHQRALIKRMLLHAGGDALKALAVSNPTTVVVKGAATNIDQLRARAEKGKVEQEECLLPSLF
ncbi:hypothetical protein CYMTET_13864, partial [Cymbomonas tetramitiformis]